VRGWYTRKAMADLKGENRPELVIGLVGAVGTDTSILEEALAESLGGVSYVSEPIRVSQLLTEFPRWSELPTSPEDVRYEKFMGAGDSLRELSHRGDAMALLAIAAIKEHRDTLTGATGDPAYGHAFILRSLKHEDEVETLEEVYGPHFFLIAGYSPREKRVADLARRIAESHGEFDNDAFRGTAEDLVERDLSDRTNALGQHVEDVFPRAHFFVDVSDPDGVRQSVSRLVELLFSHPFHTPTPDEYSMFHAEAASLRSASLGRQVGAVIATDRGDIIAVGANEVPRAGGGQYWEGDHPDGRDHVRGEDSNDTMKRLVISDLLRRLRSAKWLAAEHEETDPEVLVDQAVNPETGPLRDAHAARLIEFGRAVHAEMAALTDAARRGARVEGQVLFTTTFPCHECTRQIVAAGLSEVVYIEPYPKSLALQLFDDSIVAERGRLEESVVFRPFVGVGPRMYTKLFKMVKRKEADGKLIVWNPKEARPRVIRYKSPDYLQRETLVIEKELAEIRDLEILQEVEKEV
jgi:deoxycytidylate deaminase